MQPDPRPISTFPSRYANLAEARRRFGARVDRVGPWLLRVDESADRVVDAMEHVGHRQGWAMLERALARGIAAVDSPPDALRAFFAELDDVPPWLDEDVLDRGGRLFLRAGALAGIALGTRSLVMGYASPGGNKPLVFSGRLVEHAARRLNETARFVQAVSRPGGMGRFGDGFAITVKVRLMHAHVRRMLLRSGRWDESRWGAPINQHDMAGTTLLFSLSVLESLRTFGLRVTRDEADAYLQLWRWVGRVSGVHHDILPASEHDASQLADLIDATMGEPDDDSRALVRALFEHPRSMAKTTRERAAAEQQIVFGYGMSRALVGDALADKLAIPRSPYRHAMPAIRALVGATERVRVRSIWAERAAYDAGRRYWDRAVEIGLAGATAEFKPPERLASA